MKRKFILPFFLLPAITCFSQTTKKITPPQTTCNGTADDVPGIYTDHTQTKYGFSLKGTAAEKTVMMKNLISIEKMEEASRKDFKLTGCVARVSFAKWGNTDYGNYICARYGYTLGVYQLVCHVTEHVPKIVDEYKTVFNVTINPYILPGGANTVGTGEFYTKYGRMVYSFPIEAKPGPDFEKDKKDKPSRVSQYFSESSLLTGRSDDYKNKHTDFLKLNNGTGYVENGWGDSRYKGPSANSYYMIDRHYLITKPGVPLLIPVSRKQYLEDMLDYFEIEKANFEYLNAKSINEIGNQTADWAKKRKADLEADKIDYPKIYEAKKAKVKELLAKQKPEWLQKPAVVDQNTMLKDANQSLDALGRFYDEEGEYKSALYVLNPAYFTGNNGQAVKPLLIEVQFRYEISKDKGFAARLFNNWEKHFDINALKQMIQ
ncbi:MAG: hypothetical protein JST86_01820 [Bacteroidetes bacterium]|nr:hypothetical protein [Bacteroidota bacterium]